MGNADSFSHRSARVSREVQLLTSTQYSSGINPEERLHARRCYCVFIARIARSAWPGLGLRARARAMARASPMSCDPKKIRPARATRYIRAIKTQ